MQCVVYWNGNTLFFTLCPLWNDISWWRNTQDPESEWFTKSWWMTDLRFLFCSLVTIGLSRDTWPKLWFVFCYLNIESFATSWLQSCMLVFCLWRLWFCMKMKMSEDTLKGRCSVSSALQCAQQQQQAPGRGEEGPRSTQGQHRALLNISISISIALV